MLYGERMSQRAVLETSYCYRVNCRFAGENRAQEAVLECADELSLLDDSDTAKNYFPAYLKFQPVSLGCV